MNEAPEKDSLTVNYFLRRVYTARCTGETPLVGGSKHSPPSREKKMGYSMETIKTDIKVPFYYSHEEEEQAIADVVAYLHPMGSICYVDGFEVVCVHDQYHGGLSEDLVTDQEEIFKMVNRLSTPDRFLEAVLRAVSDRLISIEQPRVVALTPDA